MGKKKKGDGKRLAGKMNKEKEGRKVGRSRTKEKGEEMEYEKEMPQEVQEEGD